MTGLTLGDFGLRWRSRQRRFRTGHASRREYLYDEFPSQTFRLRTIGGAKNSLARFGAVLRLGLISHPDRVVASVHARADGAPDWSAHTAACSSATYEAAAATLARRRDDDEFRQRSRPPAFSPAEI